MSRNKLLSLLSAILFSLSWIALAYADGTPQSTPCGNMYGYTTGGAGKRPVGSGFGPREPPKTNNGYGSSWHKGVDIKMGGSNTTGDSLAYSTINGTVKVATYMNGYGNVIIIEGAGGVRTLYAHVPDNMMKVKVGDPVTAGQPIADYNGPSSGNSSGAHIHYETSVILDGKRVQVDPAVFEAMVAAGHCPDSPTFAATVAAATAAKHKLTSLDSLTSGAYGQPEPFVDLCTGRSTGPSPTNP